MGTSSNLALKVPARDTFIEAGPQVVVRHEPDPDFAETAALANAAFGLAPDRFSAAGMRWLYEDAFSSGTTVLAATVGGRKVGHLALVHQSVVVAGRSEAAVALMDVCLLEEFRSFFTVVTMYRAVEAFCRERAIRFIVSVPNEMAAPVNQRILRLAPVALLDIRVGFAGPPIPGCRVRSTGVDGLDRAAALDLLAPYCGTDGTGLAWTAERLWARLGRPGARYAIHAGENLLLVSMPRAGRRTAHTLISALLPRPGAAIRRRDVWAVTAAACRWHRRPLFVYAGLNAALPLPGILLPARLRPSPMSLQIRDFRPGPTPLVLDRFEPIDFDFG